MQRGGGRGYVVKNEAIHESGEEMVETSIFLV